MDQWDLTWAIAGAVFVVVELLTVTFVAIYLGIGAFAGMIVALAGGTVGWQFAAFAITGIVLMLLTRPLIKRRLESPDIPTNVNRMVGKVGIVTITIDNDSSTGQIRVGTEYWTARMIDECASEVLPVESRVVVEAVEGVTARVRPREAAPSA